jgi:hypothetical protein
MDGGAALPDRNAEPGGCVAVNVMQSANRAEAYSFTQGCDNGRLLILGKDVHDM